MTPDHVTARAHRWEHGWELDVEGVGVTQCATLDRAEKQVRDLVATMFDLPEYGGRVAITPQIGDVTPLLEDLAAHIATIEAATRAMQTTRAHAIDAMKAAGYSYADIAGAVGVSKGRISQLTHQ
ncbi:MAG: hypothetical protein Q4G43_01495 [Mobilicoccus sp.]|nr:hypothetical protein [Mobilicoccus sp.]